jgi:hypothetical protein
MRSESEPHNDGRNAMRRRRPKPEKIRGRRAFYHAVYHYPWAGTTLPEPPPLTRAQKLLGFVVGVIGSVRSAVARRLA